MFDVMCCFASATYDIYFAGGNTNQLCACTSSMNVSKIVVAWIGAEHMYATHLTHLGSKNSKTQDAQCDIFDVKIRAAPEKHCYISPFFQKFNSSLLPHVFTPSMFLFYV